MLKKKRLLQRIIALVLVAALWWQTDSMRFFVTAYAAETKESTEINEESTEVNSQNQNEEAQVTVLGEVETLRSEGEKHFRMSDGSFMAVAYGMPVHYQDEDGNWQDIDNRMVLSEDQAAYQTYNLQSTTSFASSLTEGVLFETSYDDTSVTMSLLDTSYADNLMKGETELEIEIELETEIKPELENELETEMEIENEIVLGLEKEIDTEAEIETEPESEFELETELETETEIEAEQESDSEIETETQLEEGMIELEPEQNTEVLEENIEETVNPELLVFDRTAVADTTVEVQDVLGSISDVSQTDNKDKGWTMEDIIPENIQDSILYEDVFPGVDLLYTKYSHNVKEQIIVNSVQNAYRYDFMLTLDGVEAILNEDGSVSLLGAADEEGAQKEIYYIPAPFMKDADGIVSHDVEYVLTTVSEGVVLTVVADAEWMNAKKRAFPVSIDPTIIVRAGNTENEICTSYTTQGNPNAKGEGNGFFVGYTTEQSMKEYRAFMYFQNLPVIPEGMTIVNGQLHAGFVAYDETNCDELGIGIYEVTGNKPSDATYNSWIDNLTWNTMPAYDKTNMIDYTMVSESVLNKYQYWDITEVVKKWYVEDTENRTLAMTMIPGNYSSSYCGIAGFYRGPESPPVLTVSYRNTVGIEPYYTYQTMGVGNAGTAYIADATGQLKIVNPIVSYASTINPFTLSLVYNSDYFADDSSADYQPPLRMGLENIMERIPQGGIAMRLGQGWTLDIIQTMHTETIGETMYLCYTDGDGTKHYFIKDDERNSEDDSDKTFYYDEDGLGLKAEITNTTNTSFVMYDENGNSWTFYNGRLSTISNENGNSYLIIYNNNKISEIRQVNNGNLTNNIVTFTYSGDYVSTITDKAENIYSFSYSNGRLTGIARNGEQTAIYDYSSEENAITSLKDSKSGYKRIIAYNYGKIVGSGEQVNGLWGTQFSVRYPNYSKTIYITSNAEGKLYTTYLFDYAQRTINAYVTDENNNILGASNAVYTDTRAETTKNSVSKQTNRTEKIGGIGVSNPSQLHFGECEAVGWTFYTNTAEGRMANYTNLKSRTGSFSLKMISENPEGAVYASVPSINLKNGRTYTLSAYVRTTECIGFTGDGISLRVTDSVGHSFAGKGISYATSSQIDDGWTRIQMSFTTVMVGAHTLSVYAEGVTGTFYVDDVQLEECEIAGSYNLLMNGSMEENAIWNKSDGAVYSAGTSLDESKSMKITGNPLKDENISQFVVLNLPATETFVLSGWAKGNSVPDNVTTHSDKNQDTQKQFGLRAKITYVENTSAEYYYVPFNPDVSEWQFTSLTIVPKQPDKTISTIQVICTFGGNANEAYFDNISLSREVAQTMTYDGDGNLESVSSTGLNKDVNTYQGGNLIKSVTGGNGTYTYTYDNTYKHRVTGVTDGVITQSLSYGAFGNVTGTTLKSNNSSNPLKITSSATYSVDGNRITGVTDSAGNSVEYEYGTTLSEMYALPTTTTDGRGNSTTTDYDSFGRTTEVEVPELVSISYAYEQGLLTSIEREDIEGESTQEYRFTYDLFGRTTAVYIGERRLASYAYRNTGEMISMTYANGTTIEYEYDILGRVIKETFKSGDTVKRTVQYTYDNNGQINSIKDSVSGTSNYIYDNIGRLAYYENEETDVRCRYTYDMNNRLTYTSYDLEDLMGISERYSYNSDETDGISDGTLTGMQLASTRGLSRKVDYLQRLTERTFPGGLKENYTYMAGEEANTTTTQVSIKRNTLEDTMISLFLYTYDENGNIKSVFNNATGERVFYTYDNLNQLTGATDSGRTESYSYDAHGNLLSFNNGITSHTYTYGNSDWKDLLTAVDGENIIYDAIGNPILYYNGRRYILNWTEGRKLARIIVGAKSTDYLYDASGNRIKKISSDGSYICYVNANGIALGEKHYSAEGELTKSLRYIYDENGSVCGYCVCTDGTTWTIYHFIKNLQGDVIHVYNMLSKDIVASYSYDSWGNIISATGEKAEENPFRYRGYYYDVETGFYLTGTRYYDPEIGRFINADGEISDVGGNVLGYNLFAYCFNNPVNMDDPTGQWPKWLTGALNVVSGVAQMAAGAALGAFTSWTGVGAVAAGFLIVNGAATATQGIGQIVNDVTKTNVLREDNIVRTAVKDVGRAIGGDTGAKIAGGAYDVAAVAANLYAGKVGLQQTGLAPIKVNINKVLNNPMDEFVTCGPAPGVISDYCRSIPLNGYGKIYATQLPNGFYQLANGHHRVAALRSLGKETIKIFLTK